MKLTYEELERMVKIVVANNGHMIELLDDYIKLADNFDLRVTKEKGIYTLRTKIKSN